MCRFFRVVEGWGGFLVLWAPLTWDLAATTFALWTKEDEEMSLQTLKLAPGPVWLAPSQHLAVLIIFKGCAWRVGGGNAIQMFMS